MLETFVFLCAQAWQAGSLGRREDTGGVILAYLIGWRISGAGLTGIWGDG